ncbi:ATP-binding cassette sub-family A member 7-like [Amphibalanus amphitrite]|uniref:ATP-binding cassette sub-family A member 7-like n=1 Tax=Amphibalanus amphitrite TaxID=1232801 RepID=UPI001C928DFE|nr:ATP-binding cassette sub-family A member 7-like [Amphibalanus amphitrite]XP_043218217.1 ATP-binding cassette sub-family A member 7-like [Amphibalanus amphitrite]
MGLLLQLKLLLWKNFTLRRRQKVRMVIELLWPMFLFLILMWVRSRGLKFNMHECHFEPKPMLSAGPVQFLRGFVCTFNNTCHERVPPETSAIYKEALLTRLLDDVGAVLELRVNRSTARSVRHFATDLASLRELGLRLWAGQAELRGSISLGDVITNKTAYHALLKEFGIGNGRWARTQLLGASVPLAQLPEIVNRLGLLLALPGADGLLCDSGFFSDLLRSPAEATTSAMVREICALPVADQQALLGRLIALVERRRVLRLLGRVVRQSGGGALRPDDWLAVLRLGRQVSEDLRELDTFSRLLEHVSELTEAVNLDEPESTLNVTGEPMNISQPMLLAMRFQGAVCGVDYARMAMPSGRQRRLAPINAIKDKMDEMPEQEFSNDTSISDECNELFHSLDSNWMTKFFWRTVKPFVRGKILFAPDTPVTKRVMTRVNATFEPVRQTLKFMEEWPDRSWWYRQRVLSIVRRLDSFQAVWRQAESWGAFQSLPLLPVPTNNKTLNSLTKRLSLLIGPGSEERWSQLFDTADEVAVNASVYLACFELNKLEGLSDEHALVRRSSNLTAENMLWAGVVFMDIEPGAETMPTYVRYKIRVDGDRVDSTKHIMDRMTRMGPRQWPYQDLKYITYGFAYMQDILEHSIVEELTGEEVKTGVYLHQMPYPCFIDDQFVLAISRTFPLFMVLAWVYTSAMIVKSIVYEKEQRLKEVMRILGLSNGVHWLGWFLTSFSSMVVSDVLLTIVLVYGKVLENSDPFIVFLFLLCFTMATITLSFLLSTLFSKANLAAAAGGILYFISYLPYPFLIIWDEHLDYLHKLLGSLLSNVAFGFGCSYFAHYEERGVGIQWSTIDKSPIVGDEFSLLQSMFVLLLDSFLYGLLTWYIEAVFPGQFGIPRPWFFPFMRSYWCGVEPHTIPDKESVPLTDSTGNDKFEAEPTNLPLGVAVQHLRKVYANGKVAVEDMSLNFYEGQITSFLGHNGAGKTTTISILIGLFPPTKGTAKIYNFDIRTEMDQIRQSLGICPQHNTLFDELTVAEHIWFYARLKGRLPAEVDEESDRMIEDLGLPHKRDELSKNLSGGMQRKLSIAVAFVGGSRTVILDEPTSGVDPYSRRSIWELLMKYKSGRTIILTTHFMDEADILGDRIAIIAQGQLQCCGSSLFLKSNFGSGYYLTLARFQESQVTLRISSDTEVPDGPGEPAGDPSRSVETMQTTSADRNRRASGPDQEQVTRFIQEYVRRAYLLENFGTELTYVLPNDQRLAERLERLLEALDDNLTRLGITSYGLSDTSLEEIFLRLADDGSRLSERVLSQQISSITDGGKYPTRLRTGDLRRHSLSLLNTPAGSQEQGVDTRRHSGSFAAQTTANFSDDEAPTPVTPPKVSPAPPRSAVTAKLAARGAGYTTPLWARHVCALHVKRFNHCRRNVKGLFCEIILPAFFVCLSMLFTLILPPLEEEPPLELSPWVYEPPFYVFFANDHIESSLARRYEDELIGFPGIGTKCVRENATCGNPPARTQFYAAIGKPVRTAECSCATGSMECPSGATGPAPAQAPGAGGELLLNVTDRNVSDWLVKSRPEFYKTRWGGFTFGYNNPFATANFSRYRAAVRRIGEALLGVGRDALLNVTDDQLRNQTYDISLNDTDGQTDNFTYVPFGLADDAFDKLEDFAKNSEILDNVKIWYNNKGWASSVAYMNAFNNMLLRSRFNSSVKRWYGIEAINHPLNFTRGQLRRELSKQSGISLLHAICVIFALSFVPASFTLFLIEERQCKAKHLQFVSGVRPIVYWVAEYMWDMFNYLISAGLCVAIFLAFGEEAYVSERNLPGLLLLLVLYGWSSIPLMYPASFIFTVPASAFVTLACANLFIGIVTTIATFVLEILNDEQLQMIAEILKKVFLVFPHYCLGRGLMDMAANQLRADTLAEFGFSAKRDLFEWTFLGRNLFCMLIQGVLAFLLTLLIEYRPGCRRRQLMPMAPISTDDMDVDVQRERQRVLSGRADKDILRVFNLTKVYKKGRLPAVNHLCLGVRRGECFGLLGVNGAGKTSTFKMLTGDTTISYGDAFICGRSVIDDPVRVRQQIGYCPQFDALDSLLTGREHIEFYARLRGVPADCLAHVVETNIRRLGLSPHADRTAGSYSGGNKRKLSTAIALIGDPPLVFLDEPTSGMDPAARRLLWTCVSDMVRQGCSVVLTSHSMEECEALCTRLAIMVNGQFKCLGSLQHLKSRFGDGYTVTLRAHPGQLAAVERRLQESLPQGEVREKHHSQVSYQLPSVDLRLAGVFQLLEGLRAERLVEDYSLNQTTLDEVFVRFAGEQTEMLEDEVAGSRLSLNDQSTRRFRGPKKVRFPAKQETPAPAGPVGNADGPTASSELLPPSPPTVDVGQVRLTDITAV